MHMHPFKRACMLYVCVGGGGGRIRQTATIRLKRLVQDGHGGRTTMLARL
jgi:hypothetical protein